MSAKGYTEAEWYWLSGEAEGNNILATEIQQYADKKGVEWRRIGVRWVRGRSQYYVKPERHMHETMNFD
jgi:hypothetical protein